MKMELMEIGTLKNCIHMGTWVSFFFFFLSFNIHNSNMKHITPAPISILNAFFQFIYSFAMVFSGNTNAHMSSFLKLKYNNNL